jgi:hypothetical protein
LGPIAAQAGKAAAALAATAAMSAAFIAGALDATSPVRGFFLSKFMALPLVPVFYNNGGAACATPP